MTSENPIRESEHENETMKVKTQPPSQETQTHSLEFDIESPLKLPPDLTESCLAKHI